MANHTKGRPPPNKSLCPATDKVFAEKVRKAKQVNRTPRGVPKISIEQYNEMYAAFCEQQTAGYVARKCHVHYTTAKRYVDQGDPARALRPLRDRFLSVVTSAQQREDYTLAKAREEVQLAARVLLGRIADRLGKMDPKELDPNRLSTLLKDTQIVLERTLGVADASVEVRGEGRFTDWTIEELLIFAELGQAPARDRIPIVGGAAKRLEE